jgi:hypothetical protein
MEEIYYSLIPSILVLIAAWFFDAKPEINISDRFSDFINVQINAVAIPISFSVAIITILVSSNHTNIDVLKISVDTTKKFKDLGGKKLSLFQILLSNIACNIFVEIFYLITLIVFVFLQMVVPVGVIKCLTAICIFFIIHILHILLESVTQMYLTFLTNKCD